MATMCGFVTSAWKGGLACQIFTICQIGVRVVGREVAQQDRLADGGVVAFVDDAQHFLLQRLDRRLIQHGTPIHEPTAVVLLELFSG
jgi:hypothetical protein